MIEPMVTDQMKIDLLDRLVIERRHARGNPESPNHVDYFTLKALAADARARLPTTAAIAIASVGHQIEAARKQKARIGFVEIGNQQAVAEAVIAHWPVIRRALAAIQVPEIETEPPQGDERA